MVFTTGGGSYRNVGFTTGLILPYLDIVFVGLHNLLRARADKLLGVRIVYYARVYFITCADTDMTKCYVKGLYYCFKKLIRVYKVEQTHDIVKQKLSEYLTNYAVKCEFHHIRLFFWIKV